MLVRLPWGLLDLYGPRRVTDVMAELSGLMVFRGADTALPGWAASGRLAFATGWTTLIFLVVALVMVPFGQWTAAAMRGSSGRSGLLRQRRGQPGGDPALHGSDRRLDAPRRLVRPRRARLRRPRRRDGGAEAGPRGRRGPAADAAPDDGPLREDVWSSYQKLTLVRRSHVVVNNTATRRWTCSTTPPSTASACRTW